MRVGEHERWVHRSFLMCVCERTARLALKEVISMPSSSSTWVFNSLSLYLPAFAFLWLSHQSAITRERFAQPIHRDALEWMQNIYVCAPCTRRRVKGRFTLLIKRRKCTLNVCAQFPIASSAANYHFTKGILSLIHTHTCFSIETPPRVCLRVISDAIKCERRGRSFNCRHSSFTMLFARWIYKGDVLPANGFIMPFHLKAS
jgi:predicted protein tyrosine phosphatase